MSGPRNVLLENMSHAIKTPLNAILGFSDKMMSDASLCAADKEMVAAIHQCGRSMLEMLNDAVYIERIQRGAILLDETRIDLKAFAETIRDMIRKDRGFSGFIDIRIEKGLPRYIVADEDRLARIVTVLSREITEFNTQRDLCINMGGKEGTDRLECMICNSTADGRCPDGVSGDPEEVLEADRKDLKPSLVLAALLIGHMGGGVSFHRLSKDAGGFLFEVSFKRDAVSEEDFNYDPVIRQEGPGRTLTAALDTVPPNLLSEILDAVRRTRFDILTKLIDRVGTYNKDLARSLSVMAKNYDYESILAVLGQGKE